MPRTSKPKKCRVCGSAMVRCDQFGKVQFDGEWWLCEASKNDFGQQGVGVYFRRSNALHKEVIIEKSSQLLKRLRQEKIDAQPPLFDDPRYGKSALATPLGGLDGEPAGRRSGSRRARNRGV